jgi:predicted Zn-ribbon and HTH transcriptional regulator
MNSLKLEHSHNSCRFTTLNHLNPAHKLGDAWVRVASSAQSRGGRPLILECASCRDCALEATRTQVFANQCTDCTVVLSEVADLNTGSAIILRGAGM